MPGVRGTQRCLDNLPVTLPTTAVGQPSHADYLLDTESEAQAGYLGQHRQSLCPSLTRPLSQGFTLQGHLPVAWRELAAQCRQQAALTSTIRPQDTQYLPRLQLQIDVMQHFIAASTQMQVLDLKHQLRPRTSKTGRTGHR